MATTLKAPESIPVKGFTATRLELKENEMLIHLQDRAGVSRTLALQGIISFQDSGMVRKPLKVVKIEDKDSLKKMDVQHKNGDSVFQAEFMECESR